MEEVPQIEKAVSLDNGIITDDTIIINIDDVPTVSRWYDKWSTINDEDGVINRSSTCFEFEDEFNVNDAFKRKTGRLYHWKGHSWKTTIDRKVMNKPTEIDNDNNNDNNKKNDDNDDGTTIYLNRFTQDYGEKTDIKFRYILVHRNHAGLSIGVTETQWRHSLTKKKYGDGLVKSIDFAWGNDLYDKSRGYVDGFGNVIIRCCIELIQSTNNISKVVPFMNWAEAKEKYQYNKIEIQNLKRLAESKRQQKVAEKATVEILRKVGNQFFMDKRYEEAATTYTRAINTDEGALSAVLYSNRSASYLNLGRKEDALNDALLARQLSFSRWPKAYFRVAKAKYVFGMFADSYQAAEIGMNLAHSILQCQDRHGSDLNCTKGDILELFALKSKAMQGIECEMYTYDNDIKEETADSPSNEPQNTSNPLPESSASTSDHSEHFTSPDGSANLVGNTQQQQTNHANDSSIDVDSIDVNKSSKTNDPIQFLLNDPQWSLFLQKMDKDGPKIALEWAETDPVTSMLIQKLKMIMSKQGKTVDFSSARDVSSESKCSDEYVNNNLQSCLSTNVTVLTHHYEYDDHSFAESKMMDNPQYFANSKKLISPLNPCAKEFKPAL